MMDIHNSEIAPAMRNQSKDQATRQNERDMILAGLMTRSPERAEDWLHRYRQAFDELFNHDDAFRALAKSAHALTNLAEKEALFVRIQDRLEEEIKHLEV